jgi:hypothetical protein
MKKHPLLTSLAVLACTMSAIAASFAQTASFTFNDGSGDPASGTYTRGDSFNISIMLNFTPGGSIANLAGLSYWFQQNSGSPFNFAIAGRNLSGSIFTDAQTPGITFPQSLAPSNASDLGAAMASLTGVGAGSYFIAVVTVTINATAANGTYTIGNTFAGSKTSVISDNMGNTFAIAQSTYQIVVAPDGGSTALLLAVSSLGLFGLARRQQAA